MPGSCNNLYPVDYGCQDAACTTVLSCQYHVLVGYLNGASTTYVHWLVGFSHVQQSWTRRLVQYQAPAAENRHPQTPITTLRARLSTGTLHASKNIIVNPAFSLIHPYLYRASFTRPAHPLRPPQRDPCPRPLGWQQQRFDAPNRYACPCSSPTASLRPPLPPPHPPLPPRPPHRLPPLPARTCQTGWPGSP